MKTLQILTFCSLLAAPAFAVDGVVLINQSIALAGGVTAGDTPGFPVTISVSGSYRLSGNLVVPDANTDAIDITAPNVTIDLNGFSIIGPAVCSTTACTPSPGNNGILTNQSNLSITNGTISGFQYAIYLNSQLNQIQEVKVLGNLAGIFSTAGGNRIEAVHAYGNAADGIVLEGGNNIVSRCVVASNGQIGIEGFGLVVDNIVAGNGADGIFWTGTILNNQSMNNTYNGILAAVNGTGASLISGNTTNSNGLSGISAQCPSNIVGNMATGNTGANIFTGGSGCTRNNNLPTP